MTENGISIQNFDNITKQNFKTKFFSGCISSVQVCVNVYLHVCVYKMCLSSCAYSHGDTQLKQLITFNGNL